MAGKKSEKGTLITILLTGTNGVVMTSLVIPVMEYINQSFPNDPGKVSLLMTLPMLTMIPSILITGELGKHVGKKQLCLIGTILYAVGGCAAGFGSSIDAMLAWRAVMGIGGGILFVIPNAIVSQLYEGNERANVMGYMGTAQSVLQIASGMISGILGLINWRYCFYCYSIFFIFLAMQVAYLPDLPVDVRQEKPKHKNAQYGKEFWLVAAVLFGSFATGSVFNLNVSTYVIEGGFGTSVEAGIVSTLSAVSTAVLQQLLERSFKK